MISLNKWRIKEACERKGWNITQLAAALGITSASIHRWLRLGFEEARANEIARLLGVSVAQLRERL